MTKVINTINIEAFALMAELTKLRIKAEMEYSKYLAQGSARSTYYLGKMDGIEEAIKAIAIAISYTHGKGE